MMSPRNLHQLMKFWKTLINLINICPSAVTFETKIPKTTNFYESIEIHIKLCHLYVMFVTNSEV